MSDFLNKEGKPIDVQCLSLSTEAMKEVQEAAAALGAGVYQTDLRECIPFYDPAPSETVIEGKNDARIILGRDRPYSHASGFGARGGKCGRIHLITGLASASRLKDGAQTGPNLITDAATIYMCQRTKIDEHFGIPGGSNVSSKNKSGIGIKADHVRIIGREHVKIYAGGMQNISKPNRPFRNKIGTNREKNSKGGDIMSRGRIDLIADDYKDIQPAVKGKNLVEFLQVIIEQITELYAEINEINTRCLEMNNALLLHQHPEFLGIGGSPGPVLTFKVFDNMLPHYIAKINSVIGNLNLSIETINYIDPPNIELPAQGAKYILSDSVYLT